MVLRKLLPALFVFSCLTGSTPAQKAIPAVPPQEFGKTLIPISEFRLEVQAKRRIPRPSLNPMSYIDAGVGEREGTAFCLDQECRFIGTNYHVALMSTPRKIKGEKVVRKYLATGPDDEGATMNTIENGLRSAKFALRRDLAVLELRHALPNHHGVGFSLDDLEPGQAVDIYCYPEEGINPLRHLLQFHGTFKGETTRGLLGFHYALSDGKAIHGGASGGIVVDAKTQQIVGILNAVAKNGDLTAYAVPVQALVDFVSQVQPYLAQRIFPRATLISPVSADRYSRFVWPPVDPSHHRPEEPYEVQQLRIKAQALVDNMRNFSALQTFEWGTGSADKDPAAVATYEVQVFEGHQYFREYPDGTKLIPDIPPFPPLNTVYVPAAEWSALPSMVGTEYQLKIHQADDVVVNERRIKVFQYEANVEDGVCSWRSIRDFGIFTINKDYEVSCYGEVWTDENIDILRISEHYELTKDWRDFEGVVTYGWLKRPGEVDRLVPLTISTQAKLGRTFAGRGKEKIYWCRGQFTDYRVFGSKIKILSGGDLRADPR